MSLHLLHFLWWSITRMIGQFLKELYTASIRREKIFMEKYTNNFFNDKILWYFLMRIYAAMGLCQINNLIWLNIFGSYSPEHLHKRCCEICVSPSSPKSVDRETSKQCVNRSKARHTRLQELDPKDSSNRSMVSTGSIKSSIGNRARARSWGHGWSISIRRLA